MKIASSAIITDMNNINDNVKDSNNSGNNINIDINSKEIDENEDMDQFENWMNKGKIKMDFVQRNNESKENKNNKLVLKKNF